MALSPKYNSWNFGHGIYPHELDMLPSTKLNQYYNGCERCPRIISAISSNFDADRNLKTHIGKDGFQICLDVQQFAPNEISVKTVANKIVIEANHEERQDNHGYISRQFTRRYSLPQGFNISDVVADLSSDGILAVRAKPQDKTLDQENGRKIHIRQTGPARLNNVVKENVKSKHDDEDQPERNDA